MSNFRNFDRDTGFLLPPSVHDWLPERHLAWFVAEIIDALDVSAMSPSVAGSDFSRTLLGCGHRRRFS
jgi:hypothetical protein